MLAGNFTVFINLFMNGNKISLFLIMRQAVIGRPLMRQDLKVSSRGLYRIDLHNRFIKSYHNREPY